MGDTYKELELKGLTHEQAYNTIIGLSKLAYGKKIPLHQLDHEIREKYENLEQLRSDIANEKEVKFQSIVDANLALQANETTMEDLKQFVALRKIFQKYNNGQNLDLKTDEVEPRYSFGERIN